MNAPQIIWIILASINVLLTGVLHGKERNEKYNVWSTIFGTGITVGLLLWGGFFS